MVLKWVHMVGSTFMEKVSTLNTEIPLNRYSFFEMLEDELLPNTRVEMNFEIESDSPGHNQIWI